MTGPPQRPPPDLSLYPWSQRRLEFPQSLPCPFPRYGAAINAIASPRGDIYLAGGLVNGSTVKGDLWLVEAGTSPIVCSQVTTHGEGPGPRVGHASLLVGNAFIVFGGDTKIDELDVLDETLYLLNTCESSLSRLDTTTAPLTFSSHETMVSISTRRRSTSWTIWSHSKPSGIKDIHFWRSSRGLLLQRLNGLRPECITALR